MLYCLHALNMATFGCAFGYVQKPVLSQPDSRFACNLRQPVTTGMDALMTIDVVYDGNM